MKKIAWPRFFPNRRVSVVFVLAAFCAGLFAGSSGYAARQPLPERLISRYASGDTDTFVALYEDIGRLEARIGIKDSLRIIELALLRKHIKTSECHTLLHALGHAAYGRHKGNWDLLVSHNSLLCVSSFEHGIEAQIVNEYARNPEQMRIELASYCTKLRGKHQGIPCYHGAGHAFMQQHRTNLPAALLLCDGLPAPPAPDLTDCYRGIFSEYGSEAMGINGDTGQPISGERLITLDERDPFAVCRELDPRYGRSCVSQLAKVLYKGDLLPAIALCTEVTDETWMRERCVMTIAGIYALDELSRSERINTVPEIAGQPDMIRRAYIAGTAEGYIGLSHSGIEKNWQSWCTSLPQPSDQTLCRDYMRQVVPLPI